MWCIMHKITRWNEIPNIDMNFKLPTTVVLTLHMSVFWTPFSAPFTMYRTISWFSCMNHNKFCCWCFDVSMFPCYVSQGLQVPLLFYRKHLSRSFNNCFPIVVCCRRKKSILAEWIKRVLLFFNLIFWCASCIIHVHITYIVYHHHQ